MTAKLLRSIALPLVVLVLWWGFAAFAEVNPVLLPPASAVAKALVELASSGVLLVNILTSLGRVVIGFTVAAAIALPLGLMLGLHRNAEEVADGLLNILRPIPPFAWIPIAILWFGIGDGATVFVVCYAAFFPILINTVAGVRGIERIHRKVALSIGAKGAKLFWHVIIPGCLPSIFTGLRVGLGIAWMSIVAGELVAAQRGLGFMIMFYRSLLITENVLVGMLSIGLLGFIMDQGMRIVEKRLMPWRSP